VLDTEGEEEPEIVADGEILTDELLDPVIETGGRRCGRCGGPTYTS
jgi:hypothetical protein